jgi:hypothetical protein
MTETARYFMRDIINQTQLSKSRKTYYIRFLNYLERKTLSEGLTTERANEKQELT